MEVIEFHIVCTIGLNRAPRREPPELNPFLIILTRTQHYNNSCHGRAKDQVSSAVQ